MYICKIKLHNFRRFRDLEIIFKKGRNILIGDNESGKSTIMQAIDLTARGSRHLVEDIGIETLFNVDIIKEFMGGEKKYELLPSLYVELYLSETTEEVLDGKNNSDNTIAYGVRMSFDPSPEFSREIQSVLQIQNVAFPFEFYSISFTTFSGESYNGYTKKVKTIFLDNSTVGDEHALNEYISTIYESTLSPVERMSTKHSYGNVKAGFRREVLSQFNTKLSSGFALSLKNTGKNSLEYDLTIDKDGVPITEKGRGLQCLLKTRLALDKAKDIPIILIEEPENHLSQLNMRCLIEDIEQDTGSQLFITTHSDLISTRLNLKNCILMNGASQTPVKLDFVDDDTAKFFMKAPDNNLLQFVLARRVILVEGDAEFILMDVFCKSVLGDCLSKRGIEVIAVDGKCFKRYLEIAKEIKIKVAVLTDNDGNYDENVRTVYNGYMSGEYGNIQIFSDKNDSRYTFEVAVYEDNISICDELFSRSRKSLSVENYMLTNKAEAAFRLMMEKGKDLVVPQYIQDALKWVNA